SASAVATLTSARSATAFGDPIAGITKNGITNVAEIEPSVLAARRRPAFAAIRVGSSPRSVDDAGNVKPITIVAGGAPSRTGGGSTSRTGGMIAWTDSSAFDGSILPGWAITRTSPAKTIPATRTWAIAIRAIGRRIQRRVTAKRNAPIVMPSRNTARIDVKTYV